MFIINYTSYSSPEFYNEILLNRLIQKVISDDMGFKKALSALWCLIEIRHYNKEILNYLSATYFEGKFLNNQQIENEFKKLCLLIKGLALADHKTVFWNELLNDVTNNITMTFDFELVCFLALSAINLDNMYPIELLAKIFDGKCDSSNLNFWVFCNIYQTLKMDPDYDGPLPVKSQIRLIKKMHRLAMQSNETRVYHLLGHLEEGIGGPSYVKTNVATKLFHIIGK